MGIDLILSEDVISGFRVIFGDNAEDTSINEVTRYACKRTLIQEQNPTYDMLSTMKNVY